MKLNLLLILISGFFLIGCNSSNSSTKSKICPQCNMPLAKDNAYTAYIDKDEGFDDIGCLILWAKKNQIDLDKRSITVYSRSDRSYIDAKIAYYTVDEKTPMGYGFSAYSKSKDGMIDFKEMQLRMLRGEHLANPKIRKKILGY